MREHSIYQNGRKLCRQGSPNWFGKQLMQRLEFNPIRNKFYPLNTRCTIRFVAYRGMSFFPGSGKTDGGNHGHIKLATGFRSGG
jgi:hypothetical protein